MNEERKRSKEKPKTGRRKNSACKQREEIIEVSRDFSNLFESSPKSNNDRRKSSLDALSPTDYIIHKEPLVSDSESSISDIDQQKGNSLIYSSR